MERLTKRFVNGSADCAYCTGSRIYTRNGCSVECSLWNEQLEKLAHYEELEEQGLLLRLPVPLQSKVYSVECGAVVMDIAWFFQVDQNGTWAMNSHGGYIGLWGSSVFATKAEAEKKLAEMGV